MPDVQTEDTVRAFSGTFRRISGGVDVSFDPLTASDTAVDAILVDDCKIPALILFDAARRGIKLENAHAISSFSPSMSH